MFGSQPLPAAPAYTPSSPTSLHPTPAARGPCLPLRRQQPRRSTTAATAAKENPRAQLPGCVHDRHGNGPLPEVPEVLR